jgi:hypothetical protein
MIGLYREVVGIKDGKEASYGAYSMSKAEMVAESLKELYPEQTFVLRKLNR